MSETDPPTTTNRIRQALRNPALRVTGLVVLLALVGGAATVAAPGDRHEDRGRGDVARLLAGGGGKLLVGADGEVLRDEKGRALRVGGDGKTIVDADGKAVTGADGKKLSVDDADDVRAATKGGGGDGGRGGTTTDDRPATGGGAGDGGGGGGETSGDPVVIGVAHQDPGPVQRTTGAFSVGLQASDQGPQAQAVADWINRNGGVGGHPLKLKVLKYDNINGRPYDALAQGICNSITDGQKPLAVIDRIQTNATQIPCYGAKGVPLIGDWIYVNGKAQYDRFANTLFSPGSAASDRWPAAYVRELKAQGFFNGDVRVGLVWIDQPGYGVGRDALRRALAANGVKVTLEQAFAGPRSSGDFSGVIRDVTSGVLRFSLNRINRVVAIDFGAMLGFFMKSAESNGYRPVYGLNSSTTPAALRDNVSHNQLKRSVGIGWSPILDVAAAQDQYAGGGNRARCAQIFRDAGVGIGDRSTYGQYVSYTYCDGLLLVKDALDTSKDVSPAGLRRGIEALGNDFPSATALSSRLDGSRHDGAAGYRTLRFRDDCRCFAYEGPVKALD